MNGERTAKKLPEGKPEREREINDYLDKVDVELGLRTAGWKSWRTGALDRTGALERTGASIEQEYWTKHAH
jgi:hypothetical protein